MDGILIFTLVMQNQTKRTKKSTVVQIIFAALIFMSAGTILELYLLAHFEDVEQLIPIVGIAFLMTMMVVLSFKQNQMLQKLYKLLLVLIALIGFYGMYLHLKANFEFEKEMKPTLSGWELFSESLSGALPALAPASLIALALIGYSYLILINQKQ